MIQFRTGRISLLALASTCAAVMAQDGREVESREDVSLESIRLAYQAARTLAPDLAKRLSCSGQNVVMFDQGHTEALLRLRTFFDGLGTLRSGMKTLLELPAPVAPSDQGAEPAPYVPSVLAGPVQQTLASLETLLVNMKATVGRGGGDRDYTESGLIPIIASAAAVEGCKVYWPEQYAGSLFGQPSKIQILLNEVAESVDGATGRPSLQQKTRTLASELKRAQSMIETRAETIEKEKGRQLLAEKLVEVARAQIDWLSTHVQLEKDAATQAKLNKTFSRSFDDLDAAYKRLMSASLPQTIEDQNKVSEISRRAEVMRGQTDWLSKYTRDERDLILQEKLKHTLSQNYDELTAAIRNRDTVTGAVAKTVESESKEKRRWERYAADLKDVIAVSSSAADSYAKFRTALLHSASGATPLHLLLEGEGLRGLAFDDNFQPLPGTSILRLKMHRIAGTNRSKLRGDAKIGFSGGIVLSFVQYDPTGRVKNSGVETAYIPFKAEVE